MRAAVLTAPGAPLELIDDVRCPEPGRGQVLVRLAYSGVCHSQLMEVRGRRGEDRHVPHLLGHEGTGEVVRVGDGVAKVAPGDTVVLGWIAGEGLDGGPVRYEADGRVLNAGAVTTFNEYAVVSENRLCPLPPGVPLDVGVLLGCAVPTGSGILINEIAPESGASVCFFGLGGVGLSALMACRLFDLGPVIAVDVSPEKLALARTFGATHTLDAREGDPVAAVRRIAGGDGVDYAIEASGSARVIEQAFESVRPGGGLCVFASHPAAGERIRLDPHALISGRQIRGSWGGRSAPDRDLPRFAALYRDGRLPLDALIDRRYPLDRINDALDDLEAGRVARPLIEIDARVGGARP